MTTWHSRIVLRNDSDFVIDSTAQLTAVLERGELAFAIDSNGKISGRIGVKDIGMPFRECPEVFSGEALRFPLAVEVPDGSGLDDGALLRWDPATSRFVADVEPVRIPTNQTGALTYTASGDTWSIDTSSVIPTLLDGGAYAGTPVVAPSFVVEPGFEPL